MQFGDYLASVGGHYDAAAGFDTPEQALLGRASEELSAYGPPDFSIRASGGQKPLTPTSTPWIGFFDPDESTSPQDGLYVVWLLQASLEAWTASIMMGTERRPALLKGSTGAGAPAMALEPRVLTSLRQEAAAIRSRMPAAIASPWDTAIDLKSSGRRQRRYEAATVLARTYSLAALPDDEALRSDLDALCIALQEAVAAKRELAVLDPGLISTSSATLGSDEDREYVFEPGEDKPSLVKASTKPIARTPRHEGGLRRYGEWLKTRGFSPATNVHPRDFIVQGDPEWIGEYKVVYGLNVTRATREALSQLKEYRHFMYPGNPQQPVVAVFSRAVTEQRVDWLNAEGIAVVWADGDSWRGCPIARAAGLGV